MSYLSSEREGIGFNNGVYYDRLKPDGTPRRLLDVQKIKGLGLVAKVGLKEGIEKTYEWYRKGKGK